MSQDVFEFFTVRSNPSHSASPRIFLIKKKNNKRIWAVEINEFEDEFLESQFDEEEAEFWGKLITIENGIVIIENEEQEQIIFSKNIMFGLETLVFHKHAIGRSKKKFFPCRLIAREKYKNDPGIAKSEKRYMKQLQAGVASPLGNVYYLKDEN